MVKEIGGRLGAQHHHVPAELAVQAAQVPALADLEVVADGVGRVPQIDAGSAGLHLGGVPGAVADGHAQVHVRRNTGKDVLPPVTVLIEQLFEPRPLPAVDEHRHLVVAQPLKVLQHLLVGALDHRHHDDHRGNADDDAQHGEDGPYLLRCDGPEGHFKGLYDVHICSLPPHFGVF